MTERIFYDAPVEMPILSVAGIAREGIEGSSTKFREFNGYIKNKLTKERQQFVKRRGVCFIKLFTKRGGDNGPSVNAGFARPAQP